MMLTEDVSAIWDRGMSYEGPGQQKLGRVLSINSPHLHGSDARPQLPPP